jgi:hypothetical protein
LKPSHASREWLRSTGAAKKPKAAASSNNLAARVANAQAHVQKPLGVRAATAGQWIGPATQQDHELLWRIR